MPKAKQSKQKGSVVVKKTKKKLVARGGGHYFTREELSEMLAQMYQASAIVGNIHLGEQTLIQRQKRLGELGYIVHCVFATVQSALKEQ